VKNLGLTALKVTQLVQDTCTEALLSEHHLYIKHQSVVLLSYNAFHLWSQ